MNESAARSDILIILTAKNCVSGDVGPSFSRRTLPDVPNDDTGTDTESTGLTEDTNEQQSVQTLVSVSIEH